MKISSHLFKSAGLIVLLCFTMLTSYSQQPMASPTGDSIKVWSTYYFVPIFHHDSTGVSLLNDSLRETGYKLSLCNWCTAAIEGTVGITNEEDTVIFNYSSRSDSLQNDCKQCLKYANYQNSDKTGKVLWKQSSSFGFGVNNWELIPYKTIAVDKAYIPYGSNVFIPAAVGTLYQTENGDSVIHDGYFFAGDTGSMIKGNHIDVFLGLSNYNPFDFIKSCQDSLIKVVIHKPTSE